MCEIKYRRWRDKQLLRRNVKRFRGGLILKADRLLYHSTPGSRVSKKKEEKGGGIREADLFVSQAWHQDAQQDQPH